MSIASPSFRSAFRLRSSLSPPAHHTCLSKSDDGYAIRPKTPGHQTNAAASPAQADERGGRDRGEAARPPLAHRQQQRQRRRYGNRRRGSHGRGALGGSWTSSSARRGLAPTRWWRRPGRRKCSPSRCLAGHAARVAARRAARRRGWQRQRGSCGGGPRQLVFDRRVFDRRVPRSCSTCSRRPFGPRGECASGHGSSSSSSIGRLSGWWPALASIDLGCGRPSACCQHLRRRPPALLRGRRGWPVLACGP